MRMKSTSKLLMLYQYAPRPLKSFLGCRFLITTGSFYHISFEMLILFFADWPIFRGELTNSAAGG